MPIKNHSLNKRYEYFFALKNESLTHTFNRFNCLINDMRKFKIAKPNSVLVLKFHDSIDESWEHHVDILKNSKKIKTMDLQSMFGKLRDYE